ncbi:MAG: catalase family peroxidase [Burkholderiales bacterium]
MSARLNTPSLRQQPAALAAVFAVFLPVLTAPAHAQVDPTRMIDAFEATNGKFVGARRSGAKGVCAVGEFVGNAEGRALSTASAFSGKPVPVVARFSVGGANPNAPDNTKSPRGLALAFALPGGETWQMANLSTPVFGVASPEQFLGLLESRRPDPATKQADPSKVKAFNDANPEVLLQGRYLASQPVPASYAKVNYWGVNAFAFVDAKGGRQFAKWLFEPVGGTQGLSDEEAKAKPTEFLIEELRQRVAAGAVEFNFNLQLAQPGDNVNSAVVPLPEDRKKVTVGKLTIRQVEAVGRGACINMTFNPVALPKGVEPSADPILLARAAPYAVSLGRRLSENAK